MKVSWDDYSQCTKQEQNPNHQRNNNSFLVPFGLRDKLPPDPQLPQPQLPQLPQPPQLLQLPKPPQPQPPHGSTPAFGGNMSFQVRIMEVPNKYLVYKGPKTYSA
jgi:hypothetical protein